MHQKGTLSLSRPRDRTILTNQVWDGLRDLAARLAEFYQLPLEVHTYPDE